MGAFAGDWIKERERRVLSCTSLNIVAVLSIVTFMIFLASIYLPYAPLGPRSETRHPHLPPSQDSASSARHLSSRPSPSVSPYEVTPRTRSTDATARDFGHLETSNEKAKRNPVPNRVSLGGCKQAKSVDGSQQCIIDITKNKPKASFQIRQRERNERELREEVIGQGSGEAE